MLKECTLQYIPGVRQSEVGVYIQVNDVWRRDASDALGIEASWSLA